MQALAQLRLLIFASIAVAVIIGALALQNHRLRTKNESLRADSTQLHKDLDHLLNQYVLTEQAYQALSATQLQIDKKTKTVIKRINTAPKGDDAPLAPVMRNALEAIE